MWLGDSAREEFRERRWVTHVIEIHGGFWVRLDESTNQHLVFGSQDFCLGSILDKLVQHPFDL